MRWIALIGIAAGLATCCLAQDVRAKRQHLEYRINSASVVLTAVAPDVLRVEYHPDGIKSIPTPMLDPKGLRNAKPVGTAKGQELFTRQMHVIVTSSEIRVATKDNLRGVWVQPQTFYAGEFKVGYHGENLYGMRGNGLFGPRDQRLTVSKGLLRNNGAPIAAGSQGDGGAPLVYTSHWGILVDSIDGEFHTDDSFLTFGHGSRKDIEAYIVLGPPKRTIEVVNQLTGRPPMPPKWSLGFMNSQWGTDENMVLGIVDEYRKKRIPLDAFIFDFDFKAWGEDNFGEWRWNSTNNPGNVSGNKYPDGQSGVFNKLMADRGVHMVGIMKPRALTQNAEKKPTKTGLIATANHWWMDKKPYTDYFSHRLANDFDFSKPDLRKWYWARSKNLFQTGISGWWNDEADDGFDSLGFFHMQQSLFEGQEKDSNRRVWSLNRNFYLGAQRFAFGTWSGDIGTGFQTMANQRARMLMLTDIGQSHWSMDTGGFNGHPDPENYARWMEFAAVVPIMRVHGTYGERRQPWVYGPYAERAAKQAIEWRSSMFPSFYSWEHEASQTGIGIVRPLHWQFPEDPKCANTTDAWMLGDQLLVSPVVEKGQTTKRMYLPEGTWIDYKTGRSYAGNSTIEIPTDNLFWRDMPMFVRSGSILASRPIQQYAGEREVDEITLDVWPASSHPAKFEVYDDDGETRANERGVTFSQQVVAIEKDGRVLIDFAEPKGNYPTTIQTYLVVIHTKDGMSVAVTRIAAGKAAQVNVLAR